MADVKERYGSYFDVFEILPNIVKNRDKTIVIKYGGNAMFDQEAKKSVIKDIVFLKMIGMQPIVVHGGGPAINEHMERLGLEPEFIRGQRKTTPETLEIVEMVLCGKVNNEIIKMMNFEGANAIGMSGKDMGMISARRLKGKYKNDGKIEYYDLGRVGEVTKIDTHIFDILTEHDVIPVIAPIGVGDDNRDYNINADVLAGEIASEIKASYLVYLTDVDGIMKDPKDPGSVIHEIDVEEAKRSIGKTITGGMIPKVESSLESIERGLLQASILNGMVQHSILWEILTQERIGTTIVP
ncbi:MAG: acetylglutamate kinase [Candidatus Thermoplasmatota archaeon]|nr:acetylglutamate kinase [Candidatus Thermoplasmatota archaeon]